MNQKDVIPCVFYYYLHFKLGEKYKNGTIVTIKDAMSFLFEWRLPKEIRPIIIKELEMLDLIERINKKTIRLKQSTFNVSDLREFYKTLNFY